MPEPDSFMPFYGLDFFEAVKPYPDHIVAGYLKALWHYWKHTHARGLPDDSEMLRRICDVERSEWDEAEKIIFDNDRFFYRNGDGNWHQKRAAEEWIKASASYHSNVLRAKAGAKERWAFHKKKKR